MSFLSKQAGRQVHRALRRGRARTHGSLPTVSEICGGNRAAAVVDNHSEASFSTGRTHQRTILPKELPSFPSTPLSLSSFTTPDTIHPTRQWFSAHAYSRKNDHKEEFKRLQADSERCIAAYHRGEKDQTVIHRDCFGLIQHWGTLSKTLSRRLMEQVADTMDRLTVLFIDTYDTSNAALDETQMEYQGSIRSGGTWGVSPVTTVMTMTMFVWARTRNGMRAERLMQRYLQGQQDCNDQDNIQLYRPTLELYSGLLNAISNDKRMPAHRTVYWFEQAKTQADYFRLTLYEYNAVLRAYAQEGNIQAAEAFVATIPFPKNTFTYSFLLNAYDQSTIHNKRNHVERILQECKDDCISRGYDHSVAPNGFVYAIVMKHVSGERAEELIQELSDLYNKVQDPQLLPNVQHMVTAMNAYVKEKNPVRAEELLMEMIESYEAGMDNLRPNQYAFVVVMDAWVNDLTPASIRRAEEILNSMEERRSMIDGFNNFGYNVLLKAYSKVQGGSPKAEEVFERMKRMATDHNLPALLPDKLSYTSLMQSWIRDAVPGCLQKVEKLLQTMETETDPRKRPDHITYGTVMQALSHSDEPDSVERIKELMNRLDVPWNYVHFYCVIMACRNTGRAEEAVMALRQLEDLHAKGNRDCRPNFKIYLACLDAWAASPNATEAFSGASQVLNSLLEWYDAGGNVHAPHQEAFISMFTTLGRSHITGKARAAMDLIKTMERYGTTHNEDTCARIIHTMASETGSREAKQEAWKVVMAVIEMIRRDPQLRGSASYNSAIHACANLLSDPEQARGLMEEFFRECCDHGFADGRALRSFQRYALPIGSTLLESISPRMDEILVEDIPFEWQRNLNETDSKKSP